HCGDAEPTTADELGPIAVAQDLGYVTVGLRDDPSDWLEPGVDTIVRRSLAQLDRGNVILLHDGGGNRAQTVAALGPLIDSLRARGYRLTTVSELAGLTRDEAMTPLPPSTALRRFVELTSFSLVGWFELGLRAVFLLAMALGALRLVFLLALAMRQRRLRPFARRGAAGASAAGRPTVSVVVPAYNEEGVIARTVQSLLSQGYPDLEILVVDDGSTDRTAAVVTETCGHHSCVRVFSKPNGGKASALNFGAARATGAAVVAVDADPPVAPGGFSEQTLAEDQDLTLTLLERGWRIAYADHAVAYTEAPDTLRGLSGQRFRWSFGTLQCAWKHRGTLFRSRALGWVALPNVWIFQLAFPFLAPAADLLFGWSLLTVYLNKLQHGTEYAMQSLEQVLAFYVAFLAVDWLAGIAALLMEKGEEKGLAWLVLLQRFVYRQVLYWAVVKAVIAAGQGRARGWGSSRA